MKTTGSLLVSHTSKQRTISFESLPDLPFQYFLFWKPKSQAFPSISSQVSKAYHLYLTDTVQRCLLCCYFNSGPHHESTNHSWKVTFPACPPSSSTHPTLRILIFSLLCTPPETTAYLCSSIYYLISALWWLVCLPVNSKLLNKEPLLVTSITPMAGSDIHCLNVTKFSLFSPLPNLHISFATFLLVTRSPEKLTFRTIRGAAHSVWPQLLCSSSFPGTATTLLYSPGIFSSLCTF